MDEAGDKRRGTNGEKKSEIKMVTQTDKQRHKQRAGLAEEVTDMPAHEPTNKPLMSLYLQSL